MISAKEPTHDRAMPIPKPDISKPKYVAARTNPQPEEEFYLHLADLRAALASHRTEEPLRVLDFGCGSSPYQDFFPNADYSRADLNWAENVDFIIGPDGISAESGRFDVILSTQVLEHVDDPAAYLRECFRLLRAGGKLVLTTHGTYEDHGCPQDLWRWTGDGLRKVVEQAGLQSEEVLKVTTSGRALGFLITRHLWRMQGAEKNGLGILVRILRRALRRWRRRFHLWCDRQFPDCRVVSCAKPGHEIYIALLITARKPGAVMRVQT
jgi:SAM-dependent methyltransferase